TAAVQLLYPGEYLPHRTLLLQRLLPLSEIPHTPEMGTLHALDRRPARRHLSRDDAYPHHIVPPAGIGGSGVCIHAVPYCIRARPEYCIPVGGRQDQLRTRTQQEGGRAVDDGTKILAVAGESSFPLQRTQ